MAVFKDFLPSNYTHLTFANPKNKRKASIKVDQISAFHGIAVFKTVVVFFEGTKKRMLVTPYSLEQILTVFTEGE